MPNYNQSNTFPPEKRDAMAIRKPYYHGHRRIRATWTALEHATQQEGRLPEYEVLVAPPPGDDPSAADGGIGNVGLYNRRQKYTRNLDNPLA